MVHFGELQCYCRSVLRFRPIEHPHPSFQCLRSSVWLSNHEVVARARVTRGTATLAGRVTDSGKIRRDAPSDEANLVVAS
ncbi:hypothetical protein [Candidatus Poriferisodalis sp.]|uniref:hypothetical protein n=1 Tax=Candidatus Poriferisodalis sp. TaxID=3101277 RepID=UPI003D10BCA9